MLLAKHFPRSSFYGVDADARAVSDAQAEARQRGLSNVTFACADTTPSPVDRWGQADLVLAFWSESAVAATSAWPQAALLTAREALTPDSGVLIAHGLRLLEEKKDSPLHDRAAFFYGAAFLREMYEVGQVSSSGAAGPAPTEDQPPFWEEESAADAFRRAGFQELEMHFIASEARSDTNSAFFTGRVLTCDKAALKVPSLRPGDAPLVEAPLARPNGASRLARPLIRPLQGAREALGKFFSSDGLRFGIGGERGRAGGPAPASSPPSPTDDGWRV